MPTLPRKDDDQAEALDQYAKALERLGARLRGIHEPDAEDSPPIPQDIAEPDDQDTRY